jgi:cell division septum initiation protein DivIVA
MSRSRRRRRRRTRPIATEPAAPQPAAPGPSADPISSAGRHAKSIIELAEGAAVSILAEAEAQARRYLEETKQCADKLTRARAQVVAESSDSLLEQAARIRSESSNLLANLDQAARRVQSKSS